MQDLQNKLFPKLILRNVYFNGCEGDMAHIRHLKVFQRNKVKSENRTLNM